MMQTRYLSPVLSFILSLPLTSTLYSAGIKTTSVSMPPMWQLDVGTRYWYSNATYKENLLGSANLIVSRLTYQDIAANSAEGSWKLHHNNGLFFKGYLGGGAIFNGQLIDEDFPPGISPYSKTRSPQKNGSLSYLSIDAGYDLLEQDTWRLSSFIGYHYWQENVNNFGCTQLASGPVCVTPFPTSINTLSNTAVRNSLRLGVNHTIKLHPKLTLETDLAYIRSTLSENDYHNLRSDIRGILDTGFGNGLQLDALLNWDYHEQLTLGVGVRWWYLATQALAHFEQTAVAGQPQPINGIENRYGLLVQARYHFTDAIPQDKDKVLAIENPWQGSYVGANIGYATAANLIHMNATSTNAQQLQENDATPYSLNTQTAGFLGGGQLGYEWQIKQTLVGVEADLDYTQIGGANAVTSSDAITTTLRQNISWIGSIRARLGALTTDQLLVYLTAGPAWGNVQLAFDQQTLSTACLDGAVCISTTQQQIKTGWVAGTGFEYAINPRLRFKAEYLYVDLGTFKPNVSGLSADGLTSYQLRSQFDANSLRLGFNYKLS